MRLDEIQPGLPAAAVKRPPAPLLPLAVGLILGIAADNAVALPTWSSIAALFVAGVGICLRNRKAWIGLGGVVLAGVAMGGMRHAIADRWLPENHIVFFTDREPILAKLQGRVVNVPRIVEPDPKTPRAYPVPPRTRFILETIELAGTAGRIPATGKVSVSVKEPLLALEIGDLVRITGWLYRPPGPQNPGQYDWALHNRRRGILAGLSCDHDEGVVIVSKSADALGLWQRALDRVRNRLRGYLLNDAFPDDDPGAGVLSAMVLAERSAVPRAMNEAFIRTGNAHFLAASGMNVGWLAVTFWAILRLFGVYYRTIAGIVGLIILSYVLLAEPQPSILRAGILGVLYCVSVIVRGRANIPNWLACSAIVILLIDPMDCFRPAFQYSFMAVLALIYFCPRLSERIAAVIARTARPEFGWFFRQKAYYLTLMGPVISSKRQPLPAIMFSVYWLVQLFTFSLSAWFVTTPLSCYHFDRFTPYGAVSTFLVWFLAAPVSCLGYITLLAGLLFPSSGVVFGPLLRIGTDCMTDLVELLARVPGTILDGRSPSLVWVLAVYAGLAVWIYRPGWLLWKHGFKVLSIVLFAWWLVPQRWTNPDEGALRVWVLSVGDGSGTVVELPDGQVIIYDLGTRSPFDAGQVGQAFLRHRGIRRIDAAFVSHPNFDHYSGLETLAKDFPIARLIINDHFEHFALEQTGSWRFLRELRDAGVPVEVIHAPRRFEGFGEVSVAALWPPPADQGRLLDGNEASTVLRIVYQGRSILLTGDICDYAMDRLLADGPSLQADALLLPHHGGVRSNTARFVEAVDPAVAVRSSAQSQTLTTSGVGEIVSDREYFNTADVGCVLITIKDGRLQAKATVSRRITTPPPPRFR